MGVGKTQGYTGYERKKDESEVSEDGDGDGEEVKEDIGGVFLRIKQENLHVLGGGHEGNGIWYRRSRRWRIG